MNQPPSNNISPKEILCTIEQQITPETWCKHNEAINENGVEVPPHSPEAIAWCEVGWIRKVSHDLKAPCEATYMAEEIVSWIVKKRSRSASIFDYNDRKCRTFEDIKSLNEEACKQAGVWYVQA